MKTMTDKQALGIFCECLSRKRTVSNYLVQKHIMCLVKQNDHIVWANEACSVATGKPLEKLIGSHSSFGWPELHEKFAVDDNKILDSGEDLLRFRESGDSNSAAIIVTSKYICDWQGERALAITAVNPYNFWKQLMEHPVGNAALPNSIGQIHGMMDELIKQYG